MDSELLARMEHRIRPFLMKHLSPRKITRLYSYGRQRFLEQFVKDIPREVYSPSPSLARVCWGIRFRSPLFNAAGMFKNGEGYEVVARQGAGAYLQGTTTARDGRKGNTKEGIYLPFVSYTQSEAASNFLGLPNKGDAAGARRLLEEPILYSCPRGASTMLSPDLSGEKQLEGLVQGLREYERAGADFIELNDSCPNTGHDTSDFQAMVRRLEYIKKQFLDQRVTDGIRRTRPVPVIWKVSPDMSVRDIPAYLDVAFQFGFDGINLGNTSKQYALHRGSISPEEQQLYDYYTGTFGGGVSGNPLREISFELASAAVSYMQRGPPRQEFHVIRTGGIANSADLLDSDIAGISLNQWFTGYWDAFARNGHSVYDKLYDSYKIKRAKYHFEVLRASLSKNH